MRMTTTTAGISAARRAIKRNDDAIGGHIGVRRSPRNYAIINGKEVRYTICGNTEQHGSMWSDIQYLGLGIYSRSESQWPSPT